MRCVSTCQGRVRSIPGHTTLPSTASAPPLVPTGAVSAPDSTQQAHRQTRQQRHRQTSPAVDFFFNHPALTTPGPVATLAEAIGSAGEAGFIGWTTGVGVWSGVCCPCWLALLRARRATSIDTWTQLNQCQEPTCAGCEERFYQLLGKEVLAVLEIIGQHPRSSARGWVLDHVIPAGCDTPKSVVRMVPR